MLKNSQYPSETQIKWWALYYEVFEHLIKKGLNSALNSYLNGKDFDIELGEWFDFDIQSTSLSKNMIENCLT